MVRCLEDFRAGETFATGTAEVRLEESIAFAAEHDPQDFHTDPARAAAHPLFRGLAVSGFFTLSLVHRLILEARIGHAWGLVGKGIGELKWKRPVRPGDTITVVGTILAVEPDTGQPFGTLRTAVEARNQRGERVLTMTVEAIVPTRGAARMDERRAA